MELRTGAPVAAGAPPVGAFPTVSDVLNVPPAESVVWDVPPVRQYDLIADLLDVDMLKLYSDILSSEKQRM